MLSWKRGSRKPAEQWHNLRTRKPLVYKPAEYLLAQHIFQEHASHIFNDKGKILSIDSLLNGEDGDNQWKSALSNE